MIYTPAPGITVSNMSHDVHGCIPPRYENFHFFFALQTDEGKYPGEFLNVTHEDATF